MQKKSQQGLTVKKQENFTEWFTQLMIKAELADYTAVSGAIVYRPLSYTIWEKIKQEVDKEFKKLKIKNTYFPLFIPESLLKKEEEHVKDFAPEVAWVTYGGNTKLGERLAVRPTSEAIMYDSYSKWIRSWRDLPLLLNQWNNVVRWEFNNPVPFFRGREFLWNELHTVFENKEQAIEHGKKVMEAYNKITENLMALFGMYGEKTKKEKFAGAVFSRKNHHYLSNGKVIEGTCFHHDGQNFAKAYNIKFKNREEKEEYAWQNTHAISTRILGTMFAIHSDNKGLVLPPKIAPNKIVIIPILFEESKKKIIKKSQEIKKKLRKFEPILDLRKDISPGRKFNEYELKGIPLRIEIGPRDLEKKSVTIKIRIENKKRQVKISNLEKEIEKLLGDMQKTLYENSKKLFKENTKETRDKKQLLKFIKEKKVVLIPMCNKPECEEILKSETKGAKTLFISDKSLKNEKCIFCKKPAEYWVYVGKTY
ncbi:proline--tRNA ligase [Candidatus Pacearchaeota archaeon]|nr:MAG: proline--tRNA ligase [Candidatus Pacearchaeota archaeon]